jgi:hypothetical protein
MSASQTPLPASAAASDGDGLRIVLTPLQLAALMRGETITQPETAGNHLFTRLIGGAELIGGALELAGAAGLFLTPEPTMLTKGGGVILGANGLDNAGTGFYQLWTGSARTTLTQQGAAAAARLMGASPGTANTVGIVLDIAVPLVVAGGIGAVRALSIRGGLIDLAAEEAAGGHTIARHVAKDDAFLLNRLATESAIPAAGTFASLREAEQVVSDALRANQVAITQWAASGVQKTLPLTYQAGRDIGTVILRGTTAPRAAQAVRIVLRRTTIAQKVYFVLTAYPMP